MDTSQPIDLADPTIEEAFTLLEKLVQSDLTLKIISAAVILIITSIVVHLVVKAARRIMSHEVTPLPANSIFLKIIRVVIWTFGIGFMLSFCFGQDVSAFFAALGVGGIALSLGLQDTISNAIGGINVSLSGLVKPGDHIRIDSEGLQGVVHDVTLRQTVIEDRAKNQIIVPNSVMNTSTVTKLRPVTHVVVPLVARAEDAQLDLVTSRMIEAVKQAVSEVDVITKDPVARYSEITEYGYRGTISFGIENEDRIVAATDVAVRAMALFAHGNMVAGDKVDASSEGCSNDAAVDVSESCSQGN
ncbi:MAG: mechanosensitive ion channel family protein [Eggerthellaceae bacterium]|nr:mechanosensitive ion channel family protein [Eggerthellaceae bacterium]